MKKKLKKLETSASSEANLGHKISQPIASRGQWERRLQTNIDMAKKALSEALSPDKSFSSNSLLLPESNISSDISSFCSTKQPQSFCYASSAGNIARLLQGWVKNTPKIQHSSFNGNLACGVNDASSSTVELSETFESFYESLESSNSDQISQSVVSPYGQEMPFSMLEKWLLDDAGYCQEKISIGEVNYIF